MRGACALALLAGVVAGSAQAAEPKAAPVAPSKVEPVDAELLEFLGSLDTEEEEWREFLENRPIRATGKPAVQKAPPSPPDPKQQEQVKKP